MGEEKVEGDGTNATPAEAKPGDETSGGDKTDKEKAESPVEGETETVEKADDNNDDEEDAYNFGEDEEDQFATIQQEFQEVLAELAKDKSMDAFRGEYEKLFNTLEKSNRNEKRLRTKCKELVSEIAQHVSMVDLANDQSKEDQKTIKSLKKEIEKAWKMVDTAQEGEERARETIETLNTEIQNLTKVIEEKTLGAEDSNINELRKLRDELTQQRDTLQQDLAEIKVKFEANLEEVNVLKGDKSKQEKDIADLQSEAQTRNNEMNREMRRKERAERELKQLKNDIMQKEKTLEEQTNIKNQLNDTISSLETVVKEQKDVNSGLETELGNLTDKCARLQQDFENQLSICQQLEMEVAKKSTQLHEKEDTEIKLRADISKQSKDIESLRKKIIALDSVKQGLEKDKERFKQDLYKKNKEVEEMKHQSIVDKKNLTILSNEKEAVELRLERQQQTTRNESAKVTSVENFKGELQIKLNDLKNKVENQRRYIARVEEERDKALNEGINLTKRIEELLDEVRDAETSLINARKQISTLKNDLKRKENLYHAVRTDRSQLNRAVTESHDEIADLKEKMKVLTHQFDQMKEEIVAKEQDLITEQSFKQRILKEKDNVMKDIEKMHKDLSFAIKEKMVVEKESKKMVETTRKLELEITNLKGELEKSVSHKEVLNSKLSSKQQDIDVLKRKTDVQQKVMERGENSFNEQTEDLRILKIEIRRLRDELDMYSKDSACLAQMRKEVLKLERELMQEKNKNKLLQEELENPLNVHRWRRLEGKDPETLELIHKINNLQKRLISKQELIIEKDMKFEEVDKLYKEAKLQLSRQPAYDVFDEIRNLKVEIKKRNSQIILLNTASNVYKTETGNAVKSLEDCKEELNQTKLRLVDLQRTNRKNKETIDKLRSLDSLTTTQTPSQAEEDDLNTLRVQSAGARLLRTPNRRQQQPKRGFTGGGFHLSTTIVKLE